MWNERTTDTAAPEPTSGLSYPGPALDIEDCIIESNVDGFNATLQHMMKEHGRGPWLNQALYLVCTGELFGIDPEAQKEMFDALIPHFDPSIDGIDIYLSTALTQAPWAVEQIMEAIRNTGGNSKKTREHINLIACQKAIEGHIQSTHHAAPDMFLNHDLCEMFWRKTFANPGAKKKLWSGRQWQDSEALERLMEMPKCEGADHHVARGLFNQATNAIGHKDAAELAVHLVKRGWLTPEATAIAMAGSQQPDHEKNGEILAQVVRAQLQIRTENQCAAGPAHAMRM